MQHDHQTRLPSTMLLLLLAWPVVTALMAAYGMFRYVDHTVTHATAGMTPVIVLDTPKFVDSHRGDIEAGTRETQARAKELAAEGFIVLESPTALAAPDTILIGPEDIRCSPNC